MAYLEQMKQTQIPYKIGDNIQFFDSNYLIRTGIIKYIPLPSTTKYGVLSEKLIIFIDYLQIIGKTQILNHSLPITLNPNSNVLNSLNQLKLAYAVDSCHLLANFGNFQVSDTKTASDTKKWFDKHLTLDTNNAGGGHCFYHCIVKGLTKEDNLGKMFRDRFYHWLNTPYTPIKSHVSKDEDNDDEVLRQQTEVVRQQTYNDLKKKGDDGLLQISYDGINYTQTTFLHFLEGMRFDAWADNIIISVIQTWITLMGHDKFFIIYDSNRERFTLGGSTEELPIQQLEDQINDERFFFINYNGGHYQNLRRKF